MIGINTVIEAVTKEAKARRPPTMNLQYNFHI